MKAIRRRDLAALRRVAEALSATPLNHGVDDNLHHMDEAAHVEPGRFATLEEALAACRRIVDQELTRMAKANPGISAKALYELYTQFGEDPWVMGSDWSAWDYARERCEQLVG